MLSSLFGYGNCRGGDAWVVICGEAWTALDLVKGFETICQPWDGLPLKGHPVINGLSELRRCVYDSVCGRDLVHILCSWLTSIRAQTRAAAIDVRFSNLRIICMLVLFLSRRAVKERCRARGDMLVTFV